VVWHAGRIAACASAIIMLTVASASARPMFSPAPAVTAPSAATGQLRLAAGQTDILLQKGSAPPTTAFCRAKEKISCYGPTQIEQAYNMKRLYASGDQGQGRTIVLLESFGSPTIKHDLVVFDQAYGLPAPPSFRTVNLAGKVPAFDPNDEYITGWATEATLDVEYAHALAPKARIVVATAPSKPVGPQVMRQLMEAMQQLVNHHIGDVISMSFGVTEEMLGSPASVRALGYAIKNAAHHGVTLVAASGDTGPTDSKSSTALYRHQVSSWPESDPLVTSVGGTQLHLNADGFRTAPDNVWNDIPVGIDAAAGGSPSHVFARPWYQRGVNTDAGAWRATPDISMSAAIDGGVNVFTSFKPKGPIWAVVGGTSAATPMFAGLIAVADQVAGHRLGLVTPELYRLAADDARGIVDITRGDNSFTLLGKKGNPIFTVKGTTARPGYDMASGVGTPDGYHLVHELAGR
jgi:subtilase family serine protease